jgi:hypothetical protein
MTNRLAIGLLRIRKATVDTRHVSVCSAREVLVLYRCAGVSLTWVRGDAQGSRLL